MATALDGVMAIRGAPIGGPDEAIESFRSYLLIAADRELGRDLRAKGGASDLVQETLLKAHRDLASFRGGTEEEFRSWLLAILRNCLLEFRRRYSGPGRNLGREVPLGDERRGGDRQPGTRPDHAPPSAAAIRRERAALLKDALAHLAERDRLVVSWRHEEGCTFEEIGRRLGCSLVTARAAWLRALERLRDRLSVLSEDSSLVRPG